MKKLFLAVTVLALTATPMLAADMAVKARRAPVAMEAAYDWTGFYAGLNAGYGWGETSSTNLPFDQASQIFFGQFPQTNFDASFRQAGAIAGGQMGYNWQFSDRVVAGLESDLQWSDLRGHARRVGNITGLSNMSFDAVPDRRLEWFGTLRGRLGLLVTPTLLLYGTGGLAYGETRSGGNIVFSSGIGQTILNAPIFSCSVVAPNCYAGSDRQTSLGWSAGAGGELRFGANWSAKLEYLHVDLPSTSVRLVSPSPPSGPGVSTVFRFNHQSYDFVRVGFNYKFGAVAGPVVAKY
jgi:outer membrane immunogenic protein